MTGENNVDLETQKMEKMLQFSRDIGGLESRIGALERRLDDRVVGLERQLDALKQEQNKSSAKLDALLELVQAGRVSWKTIMSLGGLVAGVAVVVSWLLDNLPKMGVI